MLFTLVNMFLHCQRLVLHEKSLKIPKGLSECVYRSRTDNTMAKRKGTKGQTTLVKTVTRIEHIELIKFNLNLVQDSY